MSKHDFEARREALLKDIRTVMDDVEALYKNSGEAGSEQAKQIKAELQKKMDAAKAQLSRFEDEFSDKTQQFAKHARRRYEDLEDQAGEYWAQGKKHVSEFSREADRYIKEQSTRADQTVRDKPYHAIGLAALAGLVVGILINRR
ncbi:DUF883 family protein [Bergeriella denitrificans]|uniref:Bacterial protein of uncharacterized function (DUF883) n=1 Tax=Bergeriella denitrificans TaxID=494 RepID=A0A378UEH2_BERDE|nr:DUF883 family protein [Bergeriella denitrificans]STZ75756.1 Bacterial protein of uncharacterised function (DUF883) [Bergeriella denitrificans]